jgi:DnaJ-class molecular chaperone
MKKSPFIGFMVLVIVIVFISGCVDQTPNNTNYKTDNQQLTGQNSNTNTSGAICTRCNGTGTITCYNIKNGAKTCNGTGILQSGATCPVCSGTGVIICPKCNGTGQI